MIQPIPNYNYNLSYNILFTKHLLSYDDNADLVLRKQFYYAFNDYYQNLSISQKNQYIWLIDLQKDEKNNLNYYNNKYSFIRVSKRYKVHGI